MTALSYAEQARLQKAAEAHALGIDDALISELVEGFYARIRTHAVLGPIFAAKVADWTPHLQRMKDFWSSIAIESGRFHGNPMLKHIAIPGLAPAHFEMWLGLWEDTLLQKVSNPDAANLFRDRAQRIAASLQTGIALHKGGLAALTKAKPDADKQPTPYRSTPVFTNETLPDGLRRAHSTKAGVWGLLKVLKGSVRYIVAESGKQQVVDAPGTVVIIPQQLHFVEPLSEMEMQVEFYDQKPEPLPY